MSGNSLSLCFAMLLLVVERLSQCDRELMWILNLLFPCLSSVHH